MTVCRAAGIVTQYYISCYRQVAMGEATPIFLAPSVTLFETLSHFQTVQPKENLMKPITTTLIGGSLLLATANPGVAHFGMVIPSEPVVTAEKRTVEISLSFSHPFEGIGMDLARPKRFSVMKDGEESDLLPDLRESKVMNHQAWKADFAVKRPGVYHFIMEPAPYWEPTEDLSIIHYTKTIVPAFGSEDGWDQPLDLPTEIVPLLRPFGNYAGNSFSGQVLLGGQPVPGADVEVEFYNQEQRFTAASDYHITQVVKADGNGIFSFTCPQPGWWGFAALNSAEYTLKDPEGHDKPVELGAVLWTYMDPWQ